MIRDSVFVMLFIATGCSTVHVPVDDIYGTYTPKSTQGSAHFWEGDVVKITADGYRHSRFTDEIGPWTEKSPYAEYAGETIIDGNRIQFVDSWLEPAELVFVQVGNTRYLLTPVDYDTYLNSDRLPEYALAAK